MTILGRHEIESPDSSIRLPSQAKMPLPEIMVWVSLAVCQCLRTWIPFGVRISNCVAWVLGSTRGSLSQETFPPDQEESWPTSRPAVSETWAEPAQESGPPQPPRLFEIKNAAKMVVTVRN